MKIFESDNAVDLEQYLMYSLKQNLERRFLINNFYQELDKLTMEANDINLNYRDYVYEDKYGLVNVTGEMEIITKVYRKHIYGVIGEKG